MLSKDFQANDDLSWLTAGVELDAIRIETGPGTAVTIETDKARELARWLVALADNIELEQWAKDEPESEAT